LYPSLLKLYNPYCHNIGTPLYKKGKSEKPFSCSLCRRSFSENYKLENHVAFVHEEKKSVGCQVCRMKFKKLAVLNKHIESEHLSENSQDFFENPDDLFDDTDDLFDDTEELYELDDRSNEEDDTGSVMANWVFLISSEKYAS
jgi:hypothetical protein